MKILLWVLSYNCPQCPESWRFTQLMLIKLSIGWGFSWVFVNGSSCSNIEQEGLSRAFFSAIAEAVATATISHIHATSRKSALAVQQLLPGYLLRILTCVCKRCWKLTVTVLHMLSYCMDVHPCILLSGNPCDNFSFTCGLQLRTSPVRAARLLVWPAKTHRRKTPHPNLTKSSPLMGWPSTWRMGQYMSRWNILNDTSLSVLEWTGERMRLRIGAYTWRGKIVITIGKEIMTPTPTPNWDWLPIQSNHIHYTTSNETAPMWAPL